MPSRKNTRGRVNFAGIGNLLGSRSRSYYSPSGVMRSVLFFAGYYQTILSTYRYESLLELVIHTFSPVLIFHFSNALIHF